MQEWISQLANVFPRSNNEKQSTWNNETEVKQPNVKVEKIT